MWVRCQNEYRVVNLDLCTEVKITRVGSVGRIFAWCANDGEDYLLGEYRDYAAKHIFDDITFFINQKYTYIMPDEQEANEKYKEVT